MKLTEKEKTILKKWGHDESEIDQIQRAIDLTTYERDGVDITEEKAKWLLGTTEWLSGISRSAFHWTSSRNDRYGKSIYINSSELFRRAWLDAPWNK